MSDVREGGRQGGRQSGGRPGASWRQIPRERAMGRFRRGSDGPVEQAGSGVWRGETASPTLQKTRDSAVLVLVRMRTSDPRPRAEPSNGSISAPSPAPLGPAPAAVQSPAPHDAELQLALLDQVIAHLNACRASLAQVLEVRPTGSSGGGASQDAVLPPRKLSADEAAERLQVTPETINAWCIAKRFPNATSLGRAGWRIPVDEVDALNIAPKSRGRMRMRRAG
jgi:hypothetical protein